MKRIVAILGMMCLFLGSINPIAAYPTSGLVGGYLFKGDAIDSSGYGNNGTVYGAILTTDRDGNPNWAYSFDKVDDYINIPDSPSLDMTNTLTIMARVYIQEFDFTNTYVVSKKSAINPTLFAYTMVLLGDDGCYYGKNCPYSPAAHTFGLELGLNNGTFKSGFWSKQKLQPQQWYCLAVTYDGSEVKLYIDGQLDSTYSLTGIIESNNNPVVIGHAPGISWHSFNGVLDDVLIYDRALVAQEVICVDPTPTPTTTPVVSTTTPPSSGTVPEPSMIILLGIGIMGTLLVMRKSRKK